MQKFFAFILALTLGAAAQTKLAPVGMQPKVVSPDDLAISTGPAGATLEQDYFRVPQPASATGLVFPCRLQLRLFDKTRLAQSCN